MCRFASKGIEGQTWVHIVGKRIMAIIEKHNYDWFDYDYM